MNRSLLELARSFVAGEVCAGEFAERYMEQWKAERDDGTLRDDSPELGEQLSTMFCLADLYNADADRAEYELDEHQLRMKIAEVLR